MRIPDSQLGSPVTATTFRDLLAFCWTSYQTVALAHSKDTKDTLRESTSLVGASNLLAEGIVEIRGGLLLCSYLASKKAKFCRTGTELRSGAVGSRPLSLLFTP